jgi:metal-responsive CopG/Arc/MetJ family transcriptional regulator
MSDIIVGVRMPKRLLLALKNVSEKRNFLDTSEAVRSIVRQQWQQATKPELRKKSFTKEKEIKEIERKRLLEKIRKLSDELKELGEENEG